MSKSTTSDPTSRKLDLSEKFGKDYSAGDIIFKEGAAGHEMFIIKKGEVVISKRIHLQEKPLATLRQGDFFGEMALLNNHPRSASAKAKTACRCLVFDSQTFEAMLKNYSEVAIRMIKKISERLRQTDAMIENLLLKDDYSKLTNSLAHLYKTDKLAGAKSAHLEDVAAHAAVHEDVAQKYFAHLEKLEIAGLKGDDRKVQVLNADRLERLRQYLAMRDEFIVLDNTPALEIEGKKRISFF